MALHHFSCAQCARPFAAVRTDAAYCSTACRAARYRARRAESELRLVETSAELAAEVLRLTDARRMRVPLAA